MTQNTPEQSNGTNRLHQATSPYLLQHAHNPVDWYEWGREALDRAKAEDKPIFLSIGYSACHWCHVMAHESFENEEIARVMNDLFVNIKVDREERPDLDDIYMRATLVYTRGHGGWPMSVWLTPDLRPFAAGTYFPPEQRYGRPGFPQVCQAIAEAWQQRRDEIDKSAAAIAEYLSASMGGPQQEAKALTLDHVDQTAEMFANAFDHDWGGIASGGTNKFPPSMAMDLMLRSARRADSDQSRKQKLLSAVSTTLNRMATGGIRDHLAGGFARYSTDIEWHVPHFEKMLYDQALISRIYLDAYQMFGDERYATVAREIFDYVIDDLQSPDGGIYSARDADSEGEEGKYYVWKYDEVIALLGEQDGAPFCEYYDIRPDGNWDDPHAPGEPKNVLRIVRDIEAHEQFAPSSETPLIEKYQQSGDEIRRKLNECRQKLLEARRQRVAPGLDDKVLCEWNGLMIASLARGGAVLDEPRYVAAAEQAAQFILEHQFENGRLARAWRQGRKLETAFLSDYAALIGGLLELFEATFEPRWLEQARELNQITLDLFWDCDGGGFFFTPSDHEELITRVKEVNDNAVPSGNSLQLMNLLRLGTLLGDGTLHGKADRMITAFGGALLENAGSGERFLSGVDYAIAQPVEVAIIGPEQAPRTAELLRVVRNAYLPNRAIVWQDPTNARQIDTPLLSNREMVGDAPTAYVCRGTVCLEPATAPDVLSDQLRP